MSFPFGWILWVLLFKFLLFIFLKNPKIHDKSKGAMKYEFISRNVLTPGPSMGNKLTIKSGVVNLIVLTTPARVIKTEVWIVAGDFIFSGFRVEPLLRSLSVDDLNLHGVTFIAVTLVESLLNSGGDRERGSLIGGAACSTFQI